MKSTKKHDKKNRFRLVQWNSATGEEWVLFVFLLESKWFTPCRKISELWKQTGESWETKYVVYSMLRKWWLARHSNRKQRHTDDYKITALIEHVRCWLHRWICCLKNSSERQKWTIMCCILSKGRSEYTPVYKIVNCKSQSDLFSWRSKFMSCVKFLVWERNLRIVFLRKQNNAIADNVHCNTLVVKLSV